MSDKTKDTKGEKGCESCGDTGVMLTEERDSPPRCAGCGKELSKHK